MTDFDNLVKFVHPDLLEDPHNFHYRAILSATERFN